MIDGGERNRSVAIQLWVIGALLPLALIVVGWSAHRDFELLWVATREVLWGDPAAIYRFGATHVLADGSPWSEGSIFPYPPHALLFFLPFAPLSYIPAFLAWNALSIAIFAWAARPYMPKGLPWVMAVLTPASLICLNFGQTGLLLGALWLLAFRGKWAAVALLTFKPHLGFLGILSIRGRAELVRIALLALALIAASAILFGPSLWLAFADQVADHGGKIGSTKRWLFAGVAPAIGYGLWGWLAFALAAGLMLARNVNVFTAATASFLISPYGFHYDMTVACLGFGLAIFAHWRAMPIRDRIPMALGFLAPVIAVGGSWWVPPILLWSLWTQLRYDVPMPEASASRSPGTSRA